VLPRTGDGAAADFVDVAETRDDLVLDLEDDLDLVEAALDELDRVLGRVGLELLHGGDRVQVRVRDGRRILEDDLEALDDDAAGVIGRCKEEEEWQNSRHVSMRVHKGTAEQRGKEGGSSAAGTSTYASRPSQCCRAEQPCT